MNWFPILSSLIGGGAMGAIITALVTQYRNKQQPIGYLKDVIDIFKQSSEYDSLVGAVMTRGDDVPGSQTIVPVDNLSVARYLIVNEGNQDIAEFNFGITLDDQDQAVDIKVESPDRHHTIIVETPVSLSQSSQEIDFTLRPFNRNDEYKFHVYFTHKGSPGQIQLSSPHSIEFKEMPTIVKTPRHVMVFLAIICVLGVLFSIATVMWVKFYFEVLRLKMNQP